MFQINRVKVQSELIKNIRPDQQVICATQTRTRNRAAAESKTIAIQVVKDV